MNRFPILFGVLRDRRKSLAIWAVALFAVSAMYIGFWPMMDGEEMQAMIDSLPEALVVGMGYDRIGTPGGYITSTVYGLVGPALMLVFSNAMGARLVAGHEEDGTLELELTSPTERGRIYLERMAAMWVCIVALSGVVMAASLVLIVIFSMGVPVVNVLAGTVGFAVFLMGMGTLSLAVGATTGRRSIALGVASALAVAAFMFDAIGPVVGQDWMSAVSPFSWYLGNDPLDNGFDWFGIARLAVVPAVAAAAGYVGFAKRDLMV